MEITDIVKIIITLIGTIITAFLIPWIRTKTTTAQRDKTAAIVKTLVSAAEQLYGAGCGADKLAYVVKTLNNMGYDIDIDDAGDTLRTMIEAAVLELQE